MLREGLEYRLNRFDGGMVRFEIETTDGRPVLRIDRGPYKTEAGIKRAVRAYMRQAWKIVLGRSGGPAWEGF